MHDLLLARALRARRLQLSDSGQLTVAAYRSQVSAADGPLAHREHVDERMSWALGHGLEPDDGVYLLELASRPLTIGQLGEALAIHSRTRQMIVLAVERLLGHGFVDVFEEPVLEQDDDEMMTSSIRYPSRVLG